jgi:hypothetical protein
MVRFSGPNQAARVVRGGLTGPHAHVRAHADSAADDVESFTGARVRGADARSRGDVRAAQVRVLVEDIHLGEAIEGSLLRITQRYFLDS